MESKENDSNCILNSETNHEQETNDLELSLNKDKKPHKLHYASSIGSIDSDVDLWTPSTVSDGDRDSGIGLQSNSCDIELLLSDNREWNQIPAIKINDSNTKLSLDHCSKTSTFSGAPKSPLYRENELQFYKAKRSSSLKTKRTPPDTPTNKMVRFADAFGLDLESVRHVFNQESPPRIPESATYDLKVDSDILSAAKILPNFQFNPRFAQPGASGNFIHRVKQQGVCLENTMADGFELSGVIRVWSFCLNKKVILRITFDNWITSLDIETSYIKDSYDGATDRFSFKMLWPSRMYDVGARAAFAIQYKALDLNADYWDSNCGQNYIYECYSTVSSSS